MSVDTPIRSEMPQKNLRYAVAGIFLMCTYFLGVATLSSGSMKVENSLASQLICQDNSWSNLPVALNNPDQECPTVAEAIIDIQAIEAGKQGLLYGNVRVWPSGELGAAAVNTGIAQRSLSISFENLGETAWYIEGKRLIGGRAITIPLKSRAQINDYPFDKYSGDWQARISPSGEYSPFLSTITVGERDIYGWQIEINPLKFTEDQNFQKVVNQNGSVGLSWNISRSGIFKISVALLVLTMIIGACAAIVLSTSILRGRRPPTITALSWLATSLFALVEIRSRFPGRPPMGIKLDTIFTYPIIAILLFLIVLHTYLWVKRDDWNMKNVYSNQE